MRRNKKFYEEKELRRLYEDYRKRRKERFQHGEWVKIEPYQRGWLRYYVLRDDIARRQDADRIQTALDLINSTQYHRTKDFLRRNRETKKMEPIPHFLKRLDADERKDLPEDILCYFTPRWEVINRWGRKAEVIRWGISHDYWFVHEVEPNMISEQWIPDPVWAQRLGELENKIQTNHLWPKFAKIHGWSRSYKECRIPAIVRNQRGEYLDKEMENYE